MIELSNCDGRRRAVLRHNDSVSASDDGFY
jgi:hypothetical protein